MTRTRQIALALKTPFTGFRWLFTDKRTFGLALAIGLLSGGLLIALLLLALFVNTPLTDYVTDRTGFWYALVWVGVLVAQLPVVFAVHRAGGALLTGKLQRALSAQVELRLNPELVVRDVSAASGALWSSMRAIAVGVPKALLLAVFILGLSLVPVAGQILAIGLTLLLSARALARDLVAIPMERRGLDDDAISAELAERPLLWFLTGAVFTGLSMVPGLNVLAIPAGVAAATARFTDVEASRGPENDGPSA